jgi:cation-transporting P-type ATPase F
MQTMTRPPWHLGSATQVIASLETDCQRGLSLDEVAARRKQYGPNVLTAKRQKSAAQRFLLQFHQPLIYVLLAATVITAALGEYVDAGVIFGVILVNAIVGFIQESKALNAINALSKTLQAHCNVIREGREVTVDSSEVVPGDVLVIRAGDKIAADARLLSTKDFHVAEAVLTGESLPVHKTANEVADGAALADRQNIAYAGTLSTRGQATAVVIGTGDLTEVGRISQLIQSAEDLATPLTRRIQQFSRVLLYAILCLAALTFVIGLVRQQPIVEIFLASVALCVAAIPEGLPAAVTIILAIGVSRMAKRRAIIRNLPAVEALGGTTVICSDKTGTLTQNSMTVTQVFSGGEFFDVSGGGYSTEGAIELQNAPGQQFSVADFHRRVALLDCLRAGALCNDARLVPASSGTAVEGDPTEAALLVVAQKAGLNNADLLEELPRIDAIPFESDNQYMATLHDGFGTHRRIYIKGSVERVLLRCANQLNAEGHCCELDSEGVAKIAAELAGSGLRVLAFARKDASADSSSITSADTQSGFTFLGLEAMIDPPRPEAFNAVKACRAAGIEVKMITGDHALTAKTIARQLGIMRDTNGEPIVATGQDISACGEAELQSLVTHADVFARVAPEQKLRLVQALQRSGHIVSMTGDGVNDAPALKQSDIGVAMGLNGTDVARESSDIVLADDNFSSIAAAVEEGRTVFSNLMKFIVWTLPTNMGEGLVVLTAMMLGAALPIVPSQILWINMTTAILLGMTLAFEPKEHDVMSRPPRKPDAPILNFPVVMRMGLMSLLLLIGSFGAFEWMLNFQHATTAEARTVAANIFVFGEIFYLFNCRSLTRSLKDIGWHTNKPALLGAALMVALQAAFTYMPVMNAVFHTAPIGVESWLFIAAFGILVYVIVEIEKRITAPIWASAARPQER